MKLYHGTSEKYAEDIIKYGLKPRGKKRSHWKGTPSHPGAVYLTNAYAVYFAQAACNGRRDRLAIFEIEVGPAVLNLFAPDEDYLEQVTRRDPVWQKQAGTDMKKRTAWFKKRAFSHFSEEWENSLARLGTCSYFGPIFPGAITRVAFLPCDHDLVFQSDPTITLINYSIMGAFYRNLTRTIFGDLDLEEDPFGRSESLPSRTGIEVMNLTAKREAA